MTNFLCLSHTCQLVIKDGIGADIGILLIIKKVHEIAYSACKLNAFFGPVITSQVCCSWKTLFDCIQSICKLDRRQLNMFLAENGYESPFLSDIDFEKMHEYVDIMKGFNEVIEKNENQKEPTLSLVVTCISLLYKHLVIERKTIKHLKSLLDALIDSLTKRFIGIFIELNLIKKNRNNSYDCVSKHLTQIFTVSVKFNKKHVKSSKTLSRRTHFWMRKTILQ